MRASILAIAVLVGLAAVPAQAGLDIDFGANVHLGDDADVWFAISSRYFDRDRETVRRWGTHHAPDDLAVALFISKHSGTSPERLFRMHGAGHGWWDIALRVGVPVDVWFVPVKRHPGPPYGKAYGYWKKHGMADRRPDALNDRDLANLVSVRMIHEYYAVPVEVAMEWRSSGRSLQALMSAEYGKRHGRAHGNAGHGHGKKPYPGKGKSKGKGR